MYLLTLLSVSGSGAPSCHRASRLLANQPTTTSSISPRANPSSPQQVIGTLPMVMARLRVAMSVRTSSRSVASKSRIRRSNSPTKCRRNSCKALEMAFSVSLSYVACTRHAKTRPLLTHGQGSINTVRPHPVKTTVENMILQSSIQAQCELFTAYLGSWKDANEPEKGQSFYTFGFIDDDVVKSTGNSIYYTPIDNSNGF